MLIRGVAGTGKTTLEQEIGEALAELGRPVVALAQSVKASREVLRQQAGFASADTVAMFLTDTKMQESARNGVVLIDEASMLDVLCRAELAFEIKPRGERVQWVLNPFRDRPEASGYAGTIGEAIDALLEAAQGHQQ